MSNRTWRDTLPAHDSWSDPLVIGYPTRTNKNVKKKKMKKIKDFEDFNEARINEISKARSAALSRIQKLFPLLDKEKAQDLAFEIDAHFAPDWKEEDDDKIREYARATAEQVSIDLKESARSILLFADYNIGESNEQRGYIEWLYYPKTGEIKRGKDGVTSELNINGFDYQDKDNFVQAHEKGFPVHGNFSPNTREDDIRMEIMDKLKKFNLNYKVDLV